MNVARIKFLLWLGSLAVAGYLGYFVYDFFIHKEELSRGVTEEELKKVLESVQEPEAPKDDVVDYESIRTVFHVMNWTGVKPPPPPPPPGPAAEAQKPKDPVSDLLVVNLIEVDTSRPERSLALVTFKHAGLAASVKREEDRILRQDEKLNAPFAHITIEEITIEGVLFGFEDSERESELVKPPGFPSDRVTIRMVGPEGPITAEYKGPPIQRNQNYVPWRPEETAQVRKNEYLIGTETAKRFEQDYSSILSRDVSYKPYKNPKTRQIEGLRVTRVSAGSMVSDHGITEGEILKSINGYKVTSASGAISFVKKTANETNTWIAVFEKQGKEFTRTYKSPPSE